MSLADPADYADKPQNYTNCLALQKSARDHAVIKTIQALA